MVGVSRMFTILLKTGTLRFHSVESSKTLDAWSAITLISPGMWLTLISPGMWLMENHMFLGMHHSHICLAMSLHGREGDPPMLHTYATVVVLSVITRM